MSVLIAGGTGFVGTALVRELTDRGHEVTVLARDPAGTDLPAGVDRVALDLTDVDEAALRDAIAGHDAVVNLVALSPLFVPRGGDEMHEAVHLGGTDALVAAAEAAGVDRFVQMSALGADPAGATHFIRAKGRAEAVVRDSALDWTIVRPSVVFGDGGEFVDFTRSLTTPYVAGLPGAETMRFQPIWVEDLAPMLADCAVEAGRAGKTYELGGPEVFTLADVARSIYASEGRSLRVVPVPMALARVGLTLGGMVPGFPMGPDQYRSLTFQNVVGGGDRSENDVTAFGVDPADLRTFEDYLDERAGGDDGSGDGAKSLLAGRATLGLFGFLLVSWLVPELAATVYDVDLYATGLIFLYIPSYLVSLVFYDGLLGLEHVVYAVQGVLPGEFAYAWDAGLLVSYYLFSAAAVAVGRFLQRGFGPRSDGSGDGAGDGAPASGAPRNGPTEGR